MVQAIGANAFLSFVEESTWGTTPGSPSMQLLKAATYGETLSANMEELRSNSINGNRAVEYVRGGNFDVGGGIPFELPLLGFATILKHVLGDNATTGAGPYTHTIKRGTLPAGLTIEKGFSDISQYFVYTGVKINSMDFTISNSGLVTGTLNVLGKDVSASGTSLGTPSSTTHTPIVHHEAAVNEGGASATVLGITGTITNNLKADDYNVGSRYRAALGEGKGDITGTVTFLFEDLTYFNKWLNETATSLDVAFTVSGGSLVIDFPNVRYTGQASPAIETDQGLVVAMNFRAIYDNTDLSDVVITVTNSEATI